MIRLTAAILNYETDFGVSSAKGTGNTKISFLKACRWQAFRKLIFTMRITRLTALKFCRT